MANQDYDYGDEQRRAKVYNEKLLIDWQRDSKPVWRPTCRALALGALAWLLLIVVVLVARGV